MNGRAPMGYHRRNNYKKKRLRNIIIFSAIVLVVLFVIFIIIGNILFKKADTPTDDDQNAHTSDTEQKNDTAPYSIQARNIDLTNLSYNSFYSELSHLSNNGATAVSIKCSDEKGNLLYSSDIAKKFGYQNTSSSLISLRSIVSSANNRNVFTSAYMTITSVAQSDPKSRAVMLAYEAALVCEIIEAGINEVVIRCPDASPDDLSDIINLSSNVKRINKDATVGIEIPSKILNSELSSEHIDKLATSFDFLALTTVKTNQDDDLVDRVDTLLTTHLFYILRYNMRASIPATDNEDIRKDLQALLAENSINNWQEIS